MSIGIGPAIPSTNLALHCDMGNTKKSWVGSPTTNYIPYPYASYNNGAFVLGYNYANLGATFTYVTGVDNPVNAPGVMEYYTGTSGYKYFSVDTTSLPATGTYTFSYYARIKIAGDATMRPIDSQLWRANGTDRSVTGDWNPTFTSEWKRYSTTGPAEASTILQYFPVHSGNIIGGYTIQYCGFQLEVGSVATPFVVGTRSTTQAIVDLTGNNTLTASSLTYNSDGTYSFNGSTNRIVTNGNITYGNNTTWEAWVYCTSNISTYNMFIGRYLPYFGFYSGNSLYFSNSVNSAQVTIQTPTTLSLNTWYHATFTTAYNGTNTVMSIYVNGVLTTTNTFTGAQTGGAAQFAIGDGQASQWYPFPGKIGAVKVYDRTLTADEILQNFSATRGRYGI